MVPGCIRHCHSPLTPPNLKNRFIQACFPKKHDISVSLEADSRITLDACLYINQYSLQFNPLKVIFFFLLSVKSHQKYITGKEGKRNAKKPLVKECTHKGKKERNAMTRYKEIIHHLSLTKRRNQRAKKLKWFSIRVSLCLNNMARSSTLLPYIWVCKLYCFPHRGKKERKRCSFHESHVCLDCPQKRSASRKLARREDIQSQRKMTTSFTGKELRVRNTLLKRLWTCIELVFAISV